jgi:hypothetical protein
VAVLDVAAGVVGAGVEFGVVRASRTETRMFRIVGIVVNLLLFQSPVVDQSGFTL